MLLIKKYTKQLNSDWDLFVQKSFNGTLFQTQKFLSYHQEKKINDCSLMFYKNQQIVAVLPAAETKQNQIKTLYSHPGASYGGLIIDSSLSFETIDEIINQLIQYAKKQNFKKIILINSPSIYCKNKNETLHYLLLWNKFNINEIYISHATKLNKPIIGLLQIRKKRYVRYNGLVESSKIPPMWHAWLHYIDDKIPSKKRKLFEWQKSHEPNLTGTIYAKKPKGSLSQVGLRQKSSADYESWKPKNK